jgi:hypothetical protein
MLLARLADKPLIFQETVVTRPRRVKNLWQEWKTQTNVHTIQLTTAPPTWPETMPDKFMREKMDVLNALNIAITRKVKRITSIIGQTSKIVVEQQSNSTLAVAAIHATTSGTNLMNL